MNPRVKQVTPLGNYELQIVFSNQEVRLFDVKPYLDKGIFEELKDISLFNSAKVFNGTVTWNNELDFCPDTLYLESK
ncbi:DUF2442 domain-containing protein [Runella salmonicolor]|uniref:DUF2442 domain-containing protein n=1 Tax=Runella salmonicolor TaxID=2950278 RepID=A0ABT1FN33_9BACT|nr:DUF2442 domain-containing protein [Runella salmonicolor]MCP1381932.1 DUF2442 domain-containing protein [Runella salmonicolor]